MGKKLMWQNFGKENEKNFPYLSTLAREMPSIAASQTSCERIFSRFAPLVTDYHRNRLDAFTVSKMITLQSIYKDF
jgi:hypothetical protein